MIPAIVLLLLLLLLLLRGMWLLTTLLTIPAAPSVGDLLLTAACSWDAGQALFLQGALLSVARSLYFQLAFIAGGVDDA